MRMHRYHVFVQFRSNGTNQQGLEFSIEPRKWRRLLVDCTVNPKFLDIHRDITEFGHSEWPTSLNIRVWLDSNRLAEDLLQLRQAFTGAVAINIFVPLPATPELQPIRRPTQIILLQATNAAAA